MGFSVYFIDQIVFMIPQGELLNSFKKLVRPFECLVWILLIIVLVSAFGAIVVLQFQSESKKTFCFGQNVKSPGLNVLVAVFGGSQHRLPRKNFSRFLLMNFLLFCLVVR
jgi:uncharacterized membrane protein (DUF485 family)